MTETRSGLRMSADERKAAVLHAAVIEFAHTGFAGTSTEHIARHAGISQPYLFRLFGTKKALFLAAIELCFEQVQANFDRAAKDLLGQEALAAMGDSYLDYLEHTDLVLLQLHAYAASGDPEIRAAVAARYEGLANFVVARTGVDEIALGQFFSIGMLLNVAAALELPRFQVICSELASQATR